MKLTLPFLLASTMAKRGRIAGARNRRHSAEGERQGRIPAAGVLHFKSRNKARDYINSQLQEFQLKRTTGLGTMLRPNRPAATKCQR